MSLDNNEGKFKLIEGFSSLRTLPGIRGAVSYGPDHFKTGDYVRVYLEQTGSTEIYSREGTVVDTQSRRRKPNGESETTLKLHVIIKGELIRRDPVTVQVCTNFSPRRWVSGRLEVVVPKTEFDQDYFYNRIIRAEKLQNQS